LPVAKVPICRKLRLWPSESRNGPKTTFSAKPGKKVGFAVTYYAVREPDFARDCAYAEHCVAQWRRHRCSAYPSFEDWRKASEQCSDEVLDRFEMNDDTRQVIKLSRLIGPQRPADAVQLHMEWEAFTYWLRSLLEADVAPSQPCQARTAAPLSGFPGMGRGTSHDSFAPRLHAAKEGSPRVG